MIAAVIPTRFHPPQLAPLLELLAADHVVPFVMESEQFDHRIYKMWNTGARDAAMAGADFIAILNDDVTILPGTLPLMARALDADPAVGAVYPDVRTPFGSLPADPLQLESTTGTWGAGGMTGFCFMIRPPFTFDESYSWWFGDDAAEETIRLSGKSVCRIVGLPIVHHADGSASRVWDELAPLIRADQALWDSRHA